MTMKYHKISDICDVCGRWVRVYTNFFDENGRACCVCESCYESEFKKKNVNGVTCRTGKVDKEDVHARDGRAEKADASKDEVYIVQTKLL